MNKRFTVISFSVAVIAVIVATVIFLRHPSDAEHQSTDDAYIHADLIPLSPQVSGIVKHVFVKDFQKIKAGDAIAELDSRDFDIAVKQSEAEVQKALAEVNRLSSLIEQNQTNIFKAKAKLNVDQANLELAEKDRIRFNRLAEDGSGSEQDKQTYEANWKIQQATKDEDTANLDSIRKNTKVLEAQLADAKAQLQLSQVNLNKSKLQLSYTHILAPVDGVVAHRTIRKGAYVHQGNTMLVIVPDQDIYVDANFRETQLTNIRIGQSVSLKVDALPDHEFSGKVASVAPASNVSFSPIAPHNATGNFTKIVQRIPIRIEFSPDQPLLERLRVGMSVIPTINTSSN